jgi:hypothetical protein
MTQQQFTKAEKFWMGFKLYQLWRFLVLNFKIYLAAIRDKRK